MSDEIPIEKLRHIMACLRHPEFGCPWDLEQSATTIAPNTLEEAYEVVDAIESGDSEHLKEELGDLLLQVVFHSQLAEEQNIFTLNDVVSGISEKLLRRHPHVFPGGELDHFGRALTLTKAGDALSAWDAVKAQEKIDKGESEESVMSAVPKGLSPFNRARKLQNQASKVGFDWTDIGPVLAKIEEELAELKEELEKKSALDVIEEELGDLLFSCVNASRFLKLDPEITLLKANNKFEKRFKLMEQMLKNTEADWADCSFEELDVLWEKAKREIVAEKQQAKFKGIT